MGRTEFHSEQLTSDDLFDKHAEVDLQQFGQTNQMMQRVQIALRDQLQRTQDRVRNDLRQQEEELWRVRSQREEAGLKLHGLGQQLARLRATSDKANESYSSLIPSREESDMKLKITTQNLEKEVADVAAQNVLGQAELHKAQAAARQAKEYNMAVKSDIAIARRMTKKTEQDTKALEKGKSAQDVYILNLQERIRPLEEEISITTQQLNIQQGQTSSITQMIRETSTELDSLGADTKRQLQQWKTSVTALQLRDEGLTAARVALKKIQDETKEVTTELNHSKGELETLTQKNQELFLAGTRQDNESKYLDGLISGIQDDQDIMEHRFSMIQKSIDSTNDEENTLSTALKKVNSEISTLEQKIKVVDRDRAKLEEEVDLHKYEQTTLSKSAKSMEEIGKGVLTKLHENEMLVSKAKNTLAKLTIDKLNTQNNISELQVALKKHLGKLKNIDPVITRYEAEIKRNNSSIDKNMNATDKLNRKYQKMLEGVEEEEPVGPLEATIKSLNKKVTLQEAEASRLEKETASSETSIVLKATELEVIQERVTMVEAKLNILNHKRLRLIQEVHTNGVETKSLKVSIQGIHTCMPRLNDLINQNSKRQSELSNECSIRGVESSRVKKELEHEISSVMAKIIETKAARNKILSEIVDVERQVLNLEKNIQLERETQATLRSSSGANDIAGMEKEIHRMKHRLEQLSRQQELMVRDMERAIYKREDIAVKYSYRNKGSLMSNSSSKSRSNGQVQELISCCKKELESILQESSECEKKSREINMEIEHIRKNLGDDASKREGQTNDMMICDWPLI